VTVQGESRRFIQTRISSGVRWGSDVQDIALPNADQLDLSMSTKSIMPGEAVAGYLMFSSGDVTLSQLRNADCLPFEVRGHGHSRTETQRRTR
jgi:hypothetical protein